MTHQVPPPSGASGHHLPPRPAPHALARQRVTDAVEDRVRAYRVTVVSAPSGYGKTTAVSDWARTRTAVAWLTLGAYDDEPNRLSARVARALQSALGRMSGPELRGLDPDDAARPEAFDLVHHALAAAPTPVCLVIDDAHRGGDALTAGLLGALLDGGPENLRIVLVGRSGVRSHVSRWVTGTPGALAGEETLAFAAGEVGALLAISDADSTSSDAPLDLDEILAATRGWPLAVQFLRLTGTSVGRASGDLLLRDYVRDNVILDLPEALRQFVLDTSVCQEFTVPLAVAVTGQADAAAHLARSVRMGLFIETYGDRESTVYRWHPLFAQLCREISDELEPGRRASAHRAAARHVEDGDPFAAIGHWLAAGEPAAAVRVVMQQWIGIVVGSDAAALDRICAALPAPFHDDPGILLVRACVHEAIGEQHMARTLLARAVARAGNAPDAVFARNLARAQLFLLDGRTALAAAAEAVNDTLVREPDQSPRTRAGVLFLLGWAGMRHRMSPARTIDQLRTAARDADALGDEVLANRARRVLAFVLGWAGELRESGAVLAVLGARTEDVSPWLATGGGTAAAAAGTIAYWAVDTRTATREFLRVLATTAPSTSFAGVARLMLALTAAGSGDEATIARAGVELEAMPRSDRHGVSWSAFRGAAQAALAEADGRVDEAVRLAEEYAEVEDVPLVTVVFAGIIRRQGRLDDALARLRRLRRYHQVSYVRAAALLTTALMHRSRGAHRAAHEACEQALGVVAREGLVRLLADDDPALHDLLHAHVRRGTAHEELIARALSPRVADGPALALSPRERVVLDMLHTSMTLAEIATALAVSTNTVKSQVRAVYRKLGVSSRQEAVRTIR